MSEYISDECITVKELIEVLQSMPDKNKEVRFFFDWNRYPVNTVINNEDHILAGDD